MCQLTPTFILYYGNMNFVALEFSITFKKADNLTIDMSLITIQTLFLGTLE